jgi:hypothetical protein
MIGQKISPFPGAPDHQHRTNHFNRFQIVSTRKGNAVPDTPVDGFQDRPRIADADKLIVIPDNFVEVILRELRHTTVAIVRQKTD